MSVPAVLGPELVEAAGAAGVVGGSSTPLRAELRLPLRSSPLEPRNELTPESDRSSGMGFPLGVGAERTSSEGLLTPADGYCSGCASDASSMLSASPTASSAGGDCSRTWRVRGPPTPLRRLRAIDAAADAADRLVDARDTQPRASATNKTTSNYY